jgi:phospholipid/cholesterol/gamma-HCH transport system substrate-binding protein
VNAPGTRSGMTLRVAALVAVLAALTSGCDWRGLNSWALPGTEGKGPGAYVIQAQLPDVNTLQPNCRVRVGDVNVGTVTKIERQGWHALLTIKLNGDVSLPANAQVSLGQTSLLGSSHIELTAPADTEPQGRLREGSLIPLSSGRAYPSTEQTLSAVSMVLNQGGIGRIQDITTAVTTAFSGREDDLRAMLGQLDTFVGRINAQTADIIAATESLNRLTGKFAAQKPVLDRGLDTIPDALEVLRRQREHLIDAVDLFGKFSALAAESVDMTKQALANELRDIGPVLESLANAGPSLTHSLNLLSTFPFTKNTLTKWFRGDYANVSLVVDMTLSRLDSAIFTGTRFEGDLTELEAQWGRTIGTLPSPYTAVNPLLAPYRFDQGP